MTKRKRIQQHYESRLAVANENFDVLDWGSREAQEARFGVLAELLTAHGLTGTNENRPSLLDIGCGLTDLETFLQTRGIHTRYVGVDITFGILRKARNQWPRRALAQADIFHATPFPPRAFDLAFCSGALNLHMGNNRDFLPIALGQLFGAVSRCAVVNFLHERTPQKYDHCFYYAVQDVLDAIPTETETVEVFDHYLDNDFTVVMWRA